MSRRNWLAFGLVAGISCGPALKARAQDAPFPGFPTQPPIRDLPFARDPSSMPGPPRSMGEAPFGQSLPPSDRNSPLMGPPRSMGELPSDFFDQGRGPLFRPQGGGGISFPLLPEMGILPLGPPGLNVRDPAGLLLPGMGSQAEGADGVLPPALPDGTAPELPSGLAEVPRIDDEPPGPPLLLDQVLVSTERSYPPFLAVLEERNVAGGNLLSAQGAFDLSLTSDSRNYPLGYYNRNLQDVFLEQPLYWNGAKVFSGYRVASGKWPEYYDNLNTRGGGAFVNGFELPLLRNREIDAKRAKVYQYEIERRKVEPTILKERVSLFKNAAKAYWAWVAAGNSYAIAQDLVGLARKQADAVRRQVEEGRSAAIDIVTLQNILLKREQQAIQANRDFQQAMIVLSLYLRDPRGLPVIPDRRSLPTNLPPILPPDASRLGQDEAVALQLRPELMSLRFQYDKNRIERQLAENQLLPSLNLYVYTEQNVGNRVRSLGPDFRPFIMESSLLFEVPLQRRVARGQIKATDAVLRQITLETVYAKNIIQTDLLNALAGLRAAYDGLSTYRATEVAWRQLVNAERKRFQAGVGTLPYLYVVEQYAYDAQILRVQAEAKYFSAVADYRAALGLDAVVPSLTGPTSPAMPATPQPAVLSTSPVEAENAEGEEAGQPSLEPAEGTGDAANGAAGAAGRPATPAVPAPSIPPPPVVPRQPAPSPAPGGGVPAPAREAVPAPGGEAAPAPTVDPAATPTSGDTRSRIQRALRRRR